MHASPFLRPGLAAFVLVPALLLAGCLPGDGDGPIHPSGAWDRRDGNGKWVPNGEYYVNVEVDRGDGAKDTAYLKMGLIMNPGEL